MSDDYLPPLDDDLARRRRQFIDSRTAYKSEREAYEEVVAVLIADAMRADDPTRRAIAERLLAAGGQLATVDNRSMALLLDTITLMVMHHVVQLNALRTEMMAQQVAQHATLKAEIIAHQAALLQAMADEMIKEIRTLREDIERHG